MNVHDDLSWLEDLDTNTFIKKRKLNLNSSNYVLHHKVERYTTLCLCVYEENKNILNCFKAIL
jgi:hypothetical protein